MSCGTKPQMEASTSMMAMMMLTLPMQVHSCLEHVLRRSNDCWQEAVERKIILLLNVVRHFDSHGDVSEIATTEEPGVFSEPDVSFECSFTVPTLPPPATSTPLRGHKGASVESLQPFEENEIMLYIHSGRASVSGGHHREDTRETLAFSTSSSWNCVLVCPVHCSRRSSFAVLRRPCWP